MTLVVEDGTGLVNAESYISVLQADEYHAAMGNTSWAAATEEAREIALRKATQYVDMSYSFRGYKTTLSQSLEWPRDWYPDDYVEWPIRNLKAAVAELALRALTTALTTDQEDRGVVEESVGPVSVKYSDSRFAGQVRFHVVDSLMSKLVGVGSNVSNMRLERA